LTGGLSDWFQSQVFSRVFSGFSRFFKLFAHLFAEKQKKYSNFDIVKTENFPEPH